MGKFLSVDPITKSYPELTPYQFASNSPIAGVDLDGLEFYYAADGKFIGRGPDKSSTEIRIATSYYVESYDPSCTVVTNCKNYKTNSEKTHLGRNETNGFTGITTLRDADLSYLLDYSAFVTDRIYSGNVEAAMLNEANAGPYKNASKLLDFKGQIYNLFGIDRNNLIDIDGTLYNANEAGNYVWGMVVERLGGIIDAEAIGDAGSLYDHGRLDEPWDKSAIRSGKAKAYSVDFSSKNSRIFEEYNVEYNDWIDGGNDGSKFKPSNLLGIYKEYEENPNKYKVDDE